MAGLAAGPPRADIAVSDTSELVDNFPGEYRERGRLIIGFFSHASHFDDEPRDLETFIPMYAEIISVMES